MNTDRQPAQRRPAVVFFICPEMSADPRENPQTAAELRDRMKYLTAQNIE